ncbi:hypothetical protein M8494_04385 [Serratia ureilytica]
MWGHKASDGKTRITAATKFFIYTQASGLVMLIAILGLVFVHYNATGVWTFDYEDLLQTPMSHSVQYLLMLGFFIAFAVKMPVVPLRLVAGRAQPGADRRFRRSGGHLAENRGLPAFQPAAIP